MYEDGKKSLSLNWGALAIKLLILAVILFIVGWLIVKLTGTGSTNNKKTLASNNSEYITNINTMKTAAFEYFTKSKLPEKVGGTEKVTLAQMINQKLLIDFTEDGKTCDTNSSYIQTTKTADNNYALKVSLTCGEQSDFIVTTIENTTCENGTCTIDNSKTNTDVVDNTDTSKSTSTRSSNKSYSTSSNSNYSNSSYTSGKSSSTTTSTVTTKVTVKISCTSNCCQNNCNNNTDNTPSPSKVRYYKYIKYSDWSNGYSNASNAENKNTTVKTYNYCKEYEKTYYSTSYVTPWTTKGYNYEIQFKDLPSDVESVAIVNKSISYFSDSTTDYQRYIDTRGSLFMTGNTGNYDASLNNATTFKNSSLKKSNFTFDVSGAYEAYGSWAAKVTINYKNTYGVTPFYASNLGYNVYLVPLKFDVRYSRNSTCTRDYESNKNNYSGYSMSDPKTETKWMHRTYEYKWSKETSLSGYTYTGEYEDRTA